jgi:hypothetical protein
MIVVTFGLSRYGCGLLLPDIHGGFGVSAGVAGINSAILPTHAEAWHDSPRPADQHLSAEVVAGAKGRAMDGPGDVGCPHRRA